MSQACAVCSPECQSMSDDDFFANESENWITLFIQPFPLIVWKTPQPQRCLNVNESEAPTLFAELQALLPDHSASVRYLAAKTLKRVSHEPSSSKAAD